MLYSLDMRNNNITNHVHILNIVTTYIATAVQSYATSPFLKSISKSIRGMDSSTGYRSCHRAVTNVLTSVSVSSVLSRRISIRHDIEM